MPLRVTRIRETVPTPTLSAAATFLMPLPSASALRICAVTKSLNLALADSARHCVDAGIIADSFCFVLAALIRRLPNCWARPRGRAAAHSHV